MKAIDILVVNELEAAFISGIEYTGNNLEETPRHSQNSMHLGLFPFGHKLQPMHHRTCHLLQ